MAQAIAETIFDIFYLGFALIAGLTMLIRGRNPRQEKIPQAGLSACGGSLWRHDSLPPQALAHLANEMSLVNKPTPCCGPARKAFYSIGNSSEISYIIKKAGLMAVLLGAGDAFHLVPRSYALWTTGLEANAAALGIGKFVTSVTMTIFYLILYDIWRARYQVENCRALTGAVWALSILRIALCLLPQNQWLTYRQPLLFGILRNIPFAMLGLIIILIFARESRKAEDGVFRFMPLAVGLSFGFYLPVVLLSGAVPAVGILMIPKTMAYVWIVSMNLQLYQQSQKQARPV